jgi:hypothetical protein
LEVVDGLSHISFGGKDQCCESFIVVLDLDVSARLFNTNRLVCKTETYILGGTDLLESLENFGISKFRVSEDSTSRLNRLNDLVGHVASEGESRRIGIYLHRSSQSLLGSCRHSVSQLCLW